MKKNILVESTKSKFQVLAQKPANVLKRIKGVLSDFGSNRNGRIYPRELWENVINSDYVKEMINSHGLVGELDHPEERLEISLQEVSHVINDMWIEGDQVMGIIDILPTPNGKIVNELLDYGTDIGISSRGAGSVGEGNIVDPDYQFITFDFVARPSCEAARLNTILEGVKVDLANNSEAKVNSILESYREGLKNKPVKYNVYYNNEVGPNYVNLELYDTYDNLEDAKAEAQSLANNASKEIRANKMMDNGNTYIKRVVDDGEEDKVYLTFKPMKEATEPGKEKFISYCKGKVKDLGTEYTQYFDRKGNIKVVLLQEIRDYGNCKVLDPDDCMEILDIDTDALVFISGKGELIATPMITTDLLASRLEFDSIDKKFYNNILKYWEDMGMEYNMKESKEMTESKSDDIPDNIYGELFRAFEHSDNKIEQKIFNLLNREAIGSIVVDKPCWWYDAGKGAPGYAHKYLEKYIKDRWGLDYLYTRFPISETKSDSGVKVVNETYKLDLSYKLNEAMSDQEVYKIVLNWYKDQIEAGKMTLNQCYELLSDKAKVSLNKLVDQSKIRESVMDKEIKKLLSEAYNVVYDTNKDVYPDTEDEEKLKEIYDNLQMGITYGEDMTQETHSWVKYPYFDAVLYLIANSPNTAKEFIGWRHYGSSAIENTLEDLKWVLDKIFKMTPTEFINKYIPSNESKIDYNMNESYYDTIKYRINNDDDLIVIRKNGEVIDKGEVDYIKDNWNRFEDFTFDESRMCYVLKDGDDEYTVEKIIVEAAGEVIYYSVQDADNRGFYVKTTKDFGDVSNKETLFKLLDALYNKGFIDLDEKEDYEFGFLSRARSDEAEFFSSHGIDLYDLDGKAIKEAYGEAPNDKKYHPILNKDLEISSPLELNTGVLPVLDVGTYGREDYIFDWERWDEEGKEEPEPDWDELDQNIVRYGTPVVEEYIKSVLPSAKVEGQKVYHPQYYNFATDELEFKVSFDVGEYNELEQKAVADPEFKDYLKNNYKSYDGFISYLADNMDEFYQQDGWKRFVQVIMFYLRDREEDFRDSTDRFWEDIIGNGYYYKD